MPRYQRRRRHIKCVGGFFYIVQSSFVTAFQDSREHAFIAPGGSQTHARAQPHAAAQRFQTAAAPRPPSSPRPAGRKPMHGHHDPATLHRFRTTLAFLASTSRKAWRDAPHRHVAAAPHIPPCGRPSEEPKEHTAPKRRGEKRSTLGNTTHPRNDAWCYDTPCAFSAFVRSALQAAARSTHKRLHTRNPCITTAHATTAPQSQRHR